MFFRLELELKKDKDIFLTQNIASLFHGVLMENISQPYAEEMHISHIRPYSQFLRFSEERIFWTICAVNDQAYEKIGLPLLADTFQTVYLKHKDTAFEILSKQVKNISMDALMEQTFFAECSRYASIHFLTPCAFKTQGHYLFYPTVRLMMQSLSMKFDEAGYDISVYTPETISDFEQNISIVQYKLQSRNFHLEGIKIPSFCGNITIKINGPQQLVNLVHMLLRFGTYSGIGIKCALGMGAISIDEKGKTGIGRDRH